jgi:uncharacterized protein YbbC (DUF1343 family)
MRYLPFLILIFLVSSLTYSRPDNDFETGCTVLIKDYNSLISGKRVALITNKTGVDKNGNHIISLFAENGINIVKIFTPEHGFSADDNYGIPQKSIPVVSLYSGHYSITEKDAEDVDVFVFDIQDLGVRYYTYTSTLYLSMLDAVKLGKTYIVCDRPSVANLDYPSGFMLNPDFESFVGKVPVPVLYGLTIGELANYLNAFYVKIDDFHVIKMKNYSRKTKYEDVMNFWISPSPSITSLESARLYPSLCFLEGTNISEGRGTASPFQIFGAPFINSDKLLNELSSYNLPGVKFTAEEFIPSREFLPSYNAIKFLNETCLGIKMEITELNAYSPFETSMAILISLKKSSGKFKWINKYFIDKLAGTDILRKMIDSGNSLEEIMNYQKKDVEIFRGKTALYKLYD